MTHLAAPTYRFTLAITRADGFTLPPVPIEPDFDPAFETTALEAMRRGELPPTAAVSGNGEVQPVWHDTLGPPYVAAFRATVAAGSRQASADIPVAYVRQLARQSSSSFVESGELQSGEVFTYRVCAYPAAPRESDERSAFSIESVAEPLPLVAGSLQSMQSIAQSRGEAADSEIPLFVAAEVIDQAIDMARRAGDVEVGGVLVGRLLYDAEVPEIFVEVTGLIPAQHTVAGATKLTFTAETWAAVDAAIALRRRQEVKVGWIHTHPLFCRQCPEERRAVCLFRKPFFSNEDRHLHRVCFSRAHHVALLVSDIAGSGLVTTAYGWSKGLVEERGFSILPATRETSNDS